MEKLPTLSVGIPAYNEEANIGKLLNELLHQRQTNFILEKILVSSDGSSDNTVNIVKNFKNKKIFAIDNKVRLGAVSRQNQITSLCESDLLVLLNADTSIQDNRCLSELIDPILKNEADMVSCKLVPLPPRNFFERVLYVSVLVKNDVAESFNNGKNLYTCHGAVRAFTKKFYKKIKFPNIVAEDAFSYLWCLTNGYRYGGSKALVYYRLPNNFKDHAKQSIRFYKAQEILKEIFGKEKVVKAHSLPAILVFKNSYKYALKFPIESILYLVVLFVMRLKSYFSPEVKVTWDMSESTRTLN